MDPEEKYQHIIKEEKNSFGHKRILKQIEPHSQNKLKKTTITNWFSHSDHLGQPARSWRKIPTQRGEVPQTLYVLVTGSNNSLVSK
jgi:hypothetical protein